MLNKSEQNFIIDIIIFIFGFSNIFPTKISIYDQYIIPIIEQNISQEHYFYSLITFLIFIIKILIILGTLAEGYKIWKYTKRYNVFGLGKYL